MVPVFQYGLYERLKDGYLSPALTSHRVAQGTALELHLAAAPNTRIPPSARLVATSQGFTTEATWVASRLCFECNLTDLTATPGNVPLELRCITPQGMLTIEIKLSIDFVFMLHGRSMVFFGPHPSWTAYYDALSWGTIAQHELGYSATDIRAPNPVRRLTEYFHTNRDRYTSVGLLISLVCRCLRYLLVHFMLPEDCTNPQEVPSCPSCSCDL